MLKEVAGGNLKFNLVLIECLVDMTWLSKLVFSLEKDYLTVCWGLSKYGVSILSIANVIFYVHKI